MTNLGPRANLQHSTKAPRGLFVGSVIMREAICNAVIYTEAHDCREQWTWGGWNLATDDDAPRPPEPSPMASAQSRRAWRQLAPADRPEG